MGGWAPTQSHQAVVTMGANVWRTLNQLMVVGFWGSGIPQMDLQPWFGGVGLLLGECGFSELLTF